MELLRLGPYRIAVIGRGGGPQWDALAKTSGDKIILLEAKANIEELADGGTKAGQGPVARPRVSRSGGLIKTCVQKTGCVTVSDVLQRHALSAGQGLPAEGRESSPNTRMIRRGRCLEVVESSITPA